MLFGAAGSDVLIGGPGRDRVSCGQGLDTARVSPEDVVLGCERVIDVSHR